MAEQPTSGSVGYGQQWPSNTSSKYNTTAFIVQQILAQARTAVLVKVMAVTGGGVGALAGTVDVQPLVNLVDGSGNATPFATIFGMPYFRLQAGGCGIIADPKVGDIGLAVIADRDISAVKSARKAANPGSARRFSLSDGLYFGGFLCDAPTRYILLNDDGLKLVDGNGNAIEMKASGTFITGPLFVSGAVTAGFGTGDAVSLQTHLHTSAAAGSPTSPPTPGS